MAGARSRRVKHEWRETFSQSSQELIARRRVSSVNSAVEKARTALKCCDGKDDLQVVLLGQELTALVDDRKKAQDELVLLRMSSLPKTSLKKHVRKSPTKDSSAWLIAKGCRL